MRWHSLFATHRRFAMHPSLLQVCSSFTLLGSDSFKFVESIVLEFDHCQVTEKRQQSEKHSPTKLYCGKW
jgi:hypothetical protein